MLHNINTPILAYMYIGNKKYGSTWLDFRYENIPMFCFHRSIVGHYEENCELKPQMHMGDEEINLEGP